MNPINDEIPTKGSVDVQNPLVLDKSTESFDKSKITENVEKNNHHENGENSNEKVREIEKPIISQNVNILESNDSKTSSDDELVNTLNQQNIECELNKKDDFNEEDNNIENFKQQTCNESDQKTKDENHCTTKDPNEKRSTAAEAESASEEDIEEFEDFEDIEIPEEEEVDEIIVPDEAEAEDLTDGKDNIENEEEATSRGSEIEENENTVNEEDTSKSSETVEKDEEDSDKKSSNTDTKEDNSSKDYDEGVIENSSTEPELVALEENNKNVDNPLEEPKSNEPSIDEDSTSQTTYDPLNCTDNKERDSENVDTGKNGNSSETKHFKSIEDEVGNDDEDDEVQFVETRNSPICIESDDDDVNSKDTTETASSASNDKNENKRTITAATATVTVPKNIIVTRTSARKSTAKPQQIQVPSNNSPTTTSQMQNKLKSFNYLPKAAITNNKRFFTGTPTQRIVDCIELLDSSDEESAPSRTRTTMQQKTPQKRTLLAAKGNYYKNNNKSTNALPTRLPNNFSPQVRQQLKKPAPPPLPPPTPQSNFLNAVQLQPASVSGSNPPAFSALLSNKSVIIPNAFYGNPPNVRASPEIELERRYARWLENFLNQFCKPQFVPTHSCFVFLQRALKYKDFVRIKTLRGNVQSHAQSATNQMNIQLMADLKTIFLKNTKKITNYGRRFCELTCSAAPGKTVALMAHAVSGKVTLKTCNMDVPKATNTSTVSSSSSSSYSGTNALTRKRQLNEDEDEYTPDKSKFKAKTNPPSENGDEDSSEMSDDRKRSLRTKRTKRIDNSFSYNEDDLLAEYEIDDEDDEKLAQLEIQRKIEQKRLEAKQQRQQQVKSFESAFIQAFAKSVDSPTTSSKATRNAPIQRVRLKNTTTATVTSIKQYTENNDAEDLLQATWIENLENDETHIISDDDEPKVHRIYKQKQQQHQQEKLQQDFYSRSTRLTNRYNTNPSPNFAGRPSRRNQEEIITGDDDYEENNYYANNPNNVDPIYWPKNIDAAMYVNGKYKDRCIICHLSCQRLVHHYVNEHRGSEVYNSRLSASQIKLLKQGTCTVSDVSLYKNGQFQYEAFCIFCQKKSRFMFPYWYQHFTMHTGEYAYRCIGCGIRKPTRSLLTQHQAQGCPEVGGVAQDYAHDPKSSQIDAKVCNLCNYVQLHRSNIVKHLHTQHNIKQILPKHIQTIVLMKMPANMPAIPPSSAPYTSVGHAKRSNNSRHSSSNPNACIIEDDDNDIIYEEIIPEDTQPQGNTENHYYNYIPPYMQAAVNSGNFSFQDADPGDDLSFMICGMLDVQMNTEAD